MKIMFFQLDFFHFLICNFDALMKDSLVINSAWGNRRLGKGLLFHSDCGSQYCSENFIRVLRDRKCLQSMSSTGNCYDNAITETFFKTLRVELTYHASFKDRDDARKKNI